MTPDSEVPANLCTRDAQTLFQGERSKDMTPNLQNLLVDLQTQQRYREADNERLAKQLSQAKAGSRRSWPRIPRFVRRRLGRPVPSV